MENISEAFVEMSISELKEIRKYWISSGLCEDITFDEYLLELGIKCTDNER